jgi:hypothetical protein
MKHMIIMESWRKYLEDDQLSEGVIENIKSLFSRAPSVGEFDPDDPPEGGWPPNSYGAFAAANGILTALGKLKAPINAKTIQQAGEIALGGGEGDVAGKLGAVVGLAVTLAGVAVGGAALAAIGIGAATLALVKAASANPGAIKKYPALAIFHVDEEYAALLDDDVEGDISEKYQEFFVNKLKTSPEEAMLDFNSFLEQIIASDFQGRTVKGSPLPRSGREPGE